MAKLTVKLHQSLRIKGEEYLFEGEFEDIKLLEALNQLLDPYPKIRDLCLSSGNKKPGILYLYDNIELASLGLFNEEIDQDMEVRIVPILHGG